MCACNVELYHVSRSREDDNDGKWRGFSAPACNYATLCIRNRIYSHLRERREKEHSIGYRVIIMRDRGACLSARVRTCMCACMRTCVRACYITSRKSGLTSRSRGYLLTHVTHTRIREFPHDLSQSPLDEEVENGKGKEMRFLTQTRSAIGRQWVIKMKEKRSFKISLKL